MRSTRRASSPSMRSRSAALDARRSLVEREELAAVDGELVERAPACPRRAGPRPSRRGSRACRCCRPPASARTSRPRRRPAPSTSAMWSRSARRSALEIGSECTNSAVRRATPSGTLVAHIRLLASPTMTSRLPPPRSKHTRRRGVEHHRRAHRAEDQARLLEPADHVDVHAGLGADAVDELAAVRRAPDRARWPWRAPRWRRRRRPGGGSAARWRPPGRRRSAGSRRAG